MKPLPALAALALATAACAGGTSAQDVPPAPAPTEPVDTDLLPSGFGSLAQDELSVLLRTEELEVRFLPIEPGLLRLLAPDAEVALASLVRQHAHTVDSIASRRGVSDPGLALVSFYGRRASARFDAQLLDLRVRGRVLRPLGIVPMDPRFSSQELGIRGTARGLYVFEEPIPVIEPIVVTYDGLESQAWAEKLPRLDRERSRVRLRAAAADTTRGP